MLPTKYINLVTAAEHGVRVPPVCFIDAETYASDTYQKMVADFCERHPSAQYIVRSAVAAEDALAQSWAGFFVSSEGVAPAQLLETVAAIYEDNQQKASMLEPVPAVGVMVMPFIASEYGGVLFTPWLHFTHHALVQYAHTPQEAVVGSAVNYELAAIDPQFVDSISSSLPNQLLQQLRTAVTTLQSLFPFALDVEWVWDGMTCYIVQVRPITIPPTAVSVQALPTDSLLQFTAFSETFGKLSPLSASLLTQVFSNAEQYWEYTEITGGAAFFTHAETGNLLVDEAVYKRYYQPRSFFSSFWRSLRAPGRLQQLEAAYDAFTPPEIFSLAATQAAFDAWQSAVALASLRGDAPMVSAQPFEYELTRPLDHLAYPTDSLVGKWKQAFFATLAPLRQQVSDEPLLAFSEIVPKPAVPTDVLERYHTQLQTSLTTYVPSSSTNKIMRVGGPATSAPVLIIAEPAHWTRPLPTDVILVVPYVPQSWVAALPKVCGIMTLSYSPLAHTSIVLREHNIPTAHIDEKTFNNIESGETISL